MQNQREIALLALYDIEYGGTYSNLAIKNYLSPDMDRQAKAFITSLVYGVTRRKLTLDYIILKYSKIKLKKLSKYVRLILEMGVYQIYFMDKVPQSAAVNESVKLAKKYAQKSSGFVNGILHSVIRNKENFEYPKDRKSFLSVYYSFTEEMINELLDIPDLEKLLESLNKEAKTSIRLNRLKCKELEIEGVELQKTPLYEYARFTTGFDVAASKEYERGEFIAQDVAAMMASEALLPKPCETVMDVCAAPGGKTTHLAELMDNKGKIFAFDIHPHKVEIIKKNASRMGIDIVDALCLDATEFHEKYEGICDKVLADVPCSGIGIIRKKPDIKWNKEDILSLPDIQYKILENASRYLKVGGELVYSTCTILKRENEDVLMRFLENNKNFEPVEIELPGTLARENKGYITFYPHIDEVDGFFISKIKRVN